jgi:hypothetical protein
MLTITGIPLSVLNRALDLYGEPREETPRVVEEIRALVPHELTSLLV